MHLRILLKLSLNEVDDEIGFNWDCVLLFASLISTLLQMSSFLSNIGPCHLCVCYSLRQLLFSQTSSLLFGWHWFLSSSRSHDMCCVRLSLQSYEIEKCKERDRERDFFSVARVRRDQHHTVRNMHSVVRTSETCTRPCIRSNTHSLTQVTLNILCSTHLDVCVYVCVCVCVRERERERERWTTIVEWDNVSERELKHRGLCERQLCGWAGEEARKESETEEKRKIEQRSPWEFRKRYILTS